jgi:hypothetical protein
MKIILIHDSTISLIRVLREHIGCFPSSARARLSLAGASDGAVGAASRAGRTVGGLGAAVGVGAGGRGNLKVLHVDEGLPAGVAARAADLGSLVVGSDVEGDEQQQVRGDDANTSEGSELLTGALAHVGSPGEVDGGEVAVGGEVDET